MKNKTDGVWVCKNRTLNKKACDTISPKRLLLFTILVPVYSGVRHSFALSYCIVLTRLSCVDTSVSAANTTRCFECLDLPNPAYCQHTAWCTEGQKCVLEEIVTSGGLVLFNSGCMSPTRCSGDTKRHIIRSRRQGSALTSTPAEDDITLCVQCCDGDFCNHEGCGNVAKKLPERGPLCFQCDYLDDPKQCRSVVQCRLGEVCMLTEWSPAVADGRPIYRSSCQIPEVCGGGTNIQKGNRAKTDCHICCNEDFCNDKCHFPLTSSTAQSLLQNVTTASSHTINMTSTRTDSTTMLPSLTQILGSGNTSHSTRMSSNQQTSHTSPTSSHSQAATMIPISSTAISSITVPPPNTAHTPSIISYTSSQFSTLTATKTSTASSSFKTSTPSTKQPAPTTPIYSSTLSTMHSSSLTQPTNASFKGSACWWKDIDTYICVCHFNEKRTCTYKLHYKWRTCLTDRCKRNRYAYDEHSNLCYAFHDDAATWDEANRRCKNEHGMLAVVDTQEKWHHLQDHISHHYQNHDVFIGGRGNGTQSHDYHWTNGDRFEFTAWAPGQPDEVREECVCVDGTDHHWHDTYCHYTHHFVCTMEP